MEVQGVLDALAPGFACAEVMEVALLPAGLLEDSQESSGPITAGVGAAGVEGMGQCALELGACGEPCMSPGGSDWGPLTAAEAARLAAGEAGVDFVGNAQAVQASAGGSFPALAGTGTAGEGGSGAVQHWMEELSDAEVDVVGMEEGTEEEVDRGSRTGSQMGSVAGSDVAEGFPLPMEFDVALEDVLAWLQNEPGDPKGLVSLWAYLVVHMDLPEVIVMKNLKKFSRVDILGMLTKAQPVLLAAMTQAAPVDLEEVAQLRFLTVLAAARVLAFRNFTVPCSDFPAWLTEGALIWSLQAVGRFWDGHCKGVPAQRLLEEAYLPLCQFGGPASTTGPQFVDILGHLVDALRQKRWLLRRHSTGSAESSGLPAVDGHQVREAPPSSPAQGMDISGPDFVGLSCPESARPVRDEDFQDVDVDLQALPALPAVPAVDSGTVRKAPGAAVAYRRKIQDYHRALARFLAAVQAINWVGGGAGGGRAAAARRAEDKRVIAQCHQRKRRQRLQAQRYRAKGPVVEPGEWARTRAAGGPKGREQPRPFSGLQLVEGDPVQDSVQGMLGVMGRFYSDLYMPWRVPAPGEGEDPTLAQNWRPIAINNVDYRLLARVLNARLAAVALRLVAEGQSNAVPGHRMGTLLALMRELFLAAAGGRWGGLLVQLDQSKAFDRVDRAYLWAVLRARGVPEGYICLLQRLYERATAVPVVEGWRGEPVPLASGLQQGCPLSPLLYVLALDPLLEAVRADGRITALGLAAVYPPPRAVLAAVTSFFCFVWSCRRFPLVREVAYRRVGEGGLGARALGPLFLATFLAANFGASDRWRAAAEGPAGPGGPRCPLR
ncbi:hypothetical protein lerEdw1_014403 [Lerista edwardsae]|nr:hypothetical protein lerEdw1_014403 [Lerista edwardsae]